MTDIDTTAAEMLEELERELNEKGTFLVFAEMKDLVRRKISRHGLVGEALSEEHFFPTIEKCLKNSSYGATWQILRAEP